MCLYLVKRSPHFQENKKLQKKISVEALTLFHQGSKPIEVAISLELGCEETEKIYQQYWRLNNLELFSVLYILNLLIF